jgi:RNA polymerase sigma-70 factor (ECF subfamily)
VGHLADSATTADEARLLQAVELAFEGDSVAMAELYRRFRSPVQACALRVVGDVHEAEDVTQQVFVKLMTSLGAFHPSLGSFQGWLLQVARNAALDHVRRRRAFPVAEVYGPDVVAPPAVSPMRGALTTALAEVPRRQRQVLFLMHVGFRPAEVARFMGTSEGAVHVLHHRARRRMLDRLKALEARPATRAARMDKETVNDRREGRRQPGSRAGSAACAHRRAGARAGDRARAALR